MEIKEKIEKVMAAAGLTAEQFAEAVGLSPSSVRSVLAGRGTISKYGVEKIDKYIADNNITIE